MRIYLSKSGTRLAQGTLPLDYSAPTPVPDELKTLLLGAPTISGASFAATDLCSALSHWKVILGDVLNRTDEDGFDVALLPLLLVLGRDLVLLERGDNQVSVE
jgi:hypothetical protein